MIALLKRIFHIHDFTNWERVGTTRYYSDWFGTSKPDDRPVRTAINQQRTCKTCGIIKRREETA